MKRFAMDWLEQWKNRSDRKPVIVEGVSGVGKTWLMKTFGDKEYRASVYIDFKLKDDRINKLFAEGLDIGCLISGLEVYSGESIRPSDTLIILDNMQEMPKALTCLRYFYEDIQDYHVICASSRSNIVSLYNAVSSLAGKVEILRLYPLSFQEFLGETESNEHLKNYLFKSNFRMIDTFRQNYVDALKCYYFVGGMPEAVLQFIESKDLNRVREVQEHILDSYKKCFTDYVPTAFYARVCEVWESIPHQLTKRNKKFIYDLIKEGERAKSYEEAIAWLDDYRFVYKVNRVTLPRTPLKDFGNANVFKLFMADVGLLGCMLELHQEILSEGNTIFDAFNGALTEQYVTQQLAAIYGHNIHFYTNERSACEICCLIDNGKEAIPVDVITKINAKDKRLRTYREKFNPVKAVQIALADYHINERLLCLPLYAVEKINAELRA